MDQAYTDTAEKWALDYLSEYYGTVGETHCFALKSRLHVHRSIYSTYQLLQVGLKCSTLVVGQCCLTSSLLRLEVIRKDNEPCPCI